MTRSLALRVPTGQGEAARRRLLEAGALRSELRLGREPGFLLLPVRGREGLPSDLGDVIEAEFDPFAVPGAPRRYQDLVEVSPELRETLPRSFDVVGDIVLVRIPPESESLAVAVGEALLRFVPNARLVGRDRGVHGAERRRQLTRLAGQGDWRTVHHENGVAIRVDVERAYFSPRLAREHAEVAAAVRAGETVYDLCCGVGPFALTIARHGAARRVVAIDRNPDAIALLRESLAHAKGAERVTPLEADVEAFLADAEPADRAILNLPHEGIKYLASVARVVRPGGTIHYYEVVARDALPRRTGELVDGIGGASRWVGTHPHVVHPYSPVSDLVAFTLTRHASEGGT